MVEVGPYCPLSGRVHRRFSIGGRYEIDELIGARMASFVFGAHDRVTDRSVSIKVLGSRMSSSQVEHVRLAQQRFLRQAAALSAIAHEQAVGIVDFGWDDALGVSYLVACRMGQAGAAVPPDERAARPSLQDIEATLLSLDDAPTAVGPPPGAPAAGIGAPGSGPDSIDMPAMIGSYRVIAALGAGGTGKVYLGQHPVIGSEVAIKVLLPEIARTPETVERFIQEARASSQIGSPHIPRYFDFGTTPAGLPYAIMEYLDGETLGARLLREGTLSIAETAAVLEQVASALLMAHDAGLVHRDLKPDNLMLVRPESKANRTMTRRGIAALDATASTIDVRVLDFGIAKMVGNRSATQTLTGSFLGTPSYCAPEQVFGHAVDARTDVYSLGATAFHMLTGAPPFVGEVPHILSSKATEDAPDLRDAGVPEAVASTIGQMLARERDRRAPSMAWVLEQVAAWPRLEARGAGEPRRAARPRGARADDYPSTLDARTVPRAASSHDGGGGDGTEAGGTDRDAWRALAPHTARDSEAGLGRADTARPPADGDLDPAATSEVIAPRGPRRVTALLITGAAILAGVLVMQLRAPRLDATERAAPAPDLRDPAQGGAMRTPPSAPTEGPPRAHGGPAPTSGPSTPAASTSAPPSPEGSVPSSTDATRSKGSGGPAEAASRSPGDERPGHGPPPNAPTGDARTGPPEESAESARGAPRHLPGKPQDKRPAAKRPTTKRPAVGDPKDVLIVDPFSPGNSARSDSP
ncbi:MAG TPA: protein kinase [Kofleriaceae bacterium]|nr:protein kinase [Kofleriaceae bacterium]